MNVSNRTKTNYFDTLAPTFNLKIQIFVNRYMCMHKRTLGTL